MSDQEAEAGENSTFFHSLACKKETTWCAKYSDRIWKLSVKYRRNDQKHMVHFSTQSLFCDISGWNKHTSTEAVPENRRRAGPAACMSHLLDSECASASFTVTTLSVIYTVNANCLSCWKQGRLCVQYADGTQMIVVSLLLVVQERKKERKKEKKPFRLSHECLLWGFGCRCVFRLLCCVVSVFVCDTE